MKIGIRASHKIWVSGLVVSGYQGFSNMLSDEHGFGTQQSTITKQVPLDTRDDYFPSQI